MDPAQKLEAAEVAQSRIINEVIERGDSVVQQFYAGAVVFITGGSGFLGKQLVEKLFRSCEIEKIYMLLRSKKNETIDERLRRFSNEPVFETLRKKKPEFHKKIIPVEGDVSELGLGISQEDRREITEQVTIIIHGAATIRFFEHIKLATLTNVRGTREVLKLAKHCKNIKSLVHISTAYSHATISRINHDVLEQFYECPMLPETLIDFVERYDDERLQIMTPHLIRNWPNTYTFTKAVAEEAVRSMSGDLPICIVRPAIVFGAHREPSAGWMDAGSAFGSMGIITGISMGVMHLLYSKNEIHLSVVPVDLVNNTVITAAHETAVRSQQGHTDIKIYNVTSTRNPVSLGKLSELTTEGIRQFPTDKARYYVYVVSIRNKQLLGALTWLTAYMPAYAIDTCTRLYGKPTKFVKLATIVNSLNDVFGYFMNNEWNIRDSNVLEMYRNLSPEDRIIYNCDIASINWKLYLTLLFLGSRKHVLQDGLNRTAVGLRKQFWFKWLNVVILSIYGSMLYKSFRLFISTLTYIFKTLKFSIAV